MEEGIDLTMMLVDAVLRAVGWVCVRMGGSGLHIEEPSEAFSAALAVHVKEKWRPMIIVERE